MSEQYNHLITSLYSLLGALELEQKSQLYLDTCAICSYLSQTTYRIAVFAPFNHGKSTLLNALLANKALPIDLVPTTGAAIVVEYGTELQTIVIFKDGTTIQQPGTKILAQYAVLDAERSLNHEVVEIRVTCCNSWLKTGVELLDLPGTNDRQTLNKLVQNKLLSANLVVHVLDARKLMTLEERKHLQNWLLSRGITNVIFVVNFLNLLTPQEQQKVRQRLYFVAESFRSNLPPGVSNIYCVDALPALRARLKGDIEAAQATGLLSFELALQTIATRQKNNQNKLSRVSSTLDLLLNEAIAKQQQLEQEISIHRAKVEQQAKIKQQAEQLIKQGFERSIAEFQQWLDLPKLLNSHQANLAIALQESRFEQWLAEFKAIVFDYQQGLNQWVKQGYQFFSNCEPQFLTLDFPQIPQISAPKSIPNPDPSTTKNVQIPSELNYVLQRKIGKVIIGKASYFLNKVASQSQSNVQLTTPQRVSSQMYADAAKIYLSEFSDRANFCLNNYEKLADGFLRVPNPCDTRNDHQLRLLNNLVDNLKTELDRLNN